MHTRARIQSGSCWPSSPVRKQVRPTGPGAKPAALLPNRTRPSGVVRPLNEEEQTKGSFSCKILMVWVRVCKGRCCTRVCPVILTSGYVVPQSWLWSGGGSGLQGHSNQNQQDKASPPPLRVLIPPGNCWRPQRVGTALASPLKLQIIKCHL